MSTKNNKAYKDVLKELEKVRKLSQYNTYKNALVSIKHSSEDEKLGELIDKYTEKFGEITDRTKARQYPTARHLLECSDVHKEVLKEYCLEIVKSGKPEWQVCAEANGWAPCKEE